MQFKIAVLALVTAFTAQFASAADGSSTASLHPEKQFGASVGLGDPFPGLLGINVGYNLNKDIRLTAGYAEVEVTTSISFTGNGFESESIKATTMAAGAEYLFTDWAVRPVVGLKAGYFAVEGKGEISLNGFEGSKGYAYSNLGIDYIAQGGFHAAVGMNMALANASGTGFYTNLGYYY